MCVFGHINQGVLRLQQCLAYTNRYTIEDMNMHFEHLS